MTLVEFLCARLNEDEATAQAAGGDEWFGSADRARAWNTSLPAFEIFGEANTGEHAVHIARHDPARVLAEVEAKRRIIGEHYIWPERSHLTGVWAEPDPMCGVCVSMQMDQDAGGNRFRDLEHVAWPCPTLRLLALPYADHSDYRAEEWAP